MKKHKELQWTILKLLKWTAAYFNDRDIDNPRSEAEILLAHALGLNRIDLYLKYDKPLERNELAQFKFLVKRRAGREPSAYITRVKEFWSLDFQVGPDVLIPRPETECLVEEVLALMDTDAKGGPYHVLDMGTGSGAVILSLAHERPAHRYAAMDRSIKALFQAKHNARKHHLEETVSFFCGDWTCPLKTEGEKFDFIVSNPPYIKNKDMNSLQPEVGLFEPKSALDGGAQGMDCLNRLIEDACFFLKTGGWLVLEMGFDQKESVEKAAKKDGRYDALRFRKDYSGMDRVVLMKKAE